jgi:hypothetical protein
LPASRKSIKFTPNNAKEALNIFWRCAMAKVEAIKEIAIEIRLFKRGEL